ncbi:MAG: IPTL-CTERM sorting domain-containing protein [Phycisphaerae bacterium]
MFRQTKRSAFVPGDRNEEGEPVTGSSNARKMFHWFTLVSFCAAAASPLEAQTFEWAKSAGGTDPDGGSGIAVDASGNSYVTGGFHGTATFGPFTLTSAGDQDVFVAKYDTAGSVAWAESAGGTSSEVVVQSIAVDASGNSYVTGWFGGTVTFGTFTLTSAGNDDVFVAKYDSAGNVMWAESASGMDRIQARGIAVDASGNSLVTGLFDGTATFGPFTLTSAGDPDVFVAKYDTAGNVGWAESAGGTDTDVGAGIAVDASGNSYVTGWFGGTATFGTFTLTSVGDVDVFVAKYDSAGNVVWAESAGGTDFDQGYGIAVDGSGNSDVTGYFGGTATFGTITLTSAGGLDVFVAKYDSAGNVVWAESAGGTDWEGAFGIAVDASGNRYVTGWFEGTATFGTFTLTSAGFLDVFVAKYDSAGNVVWAESAGGTDFDEGDGIAVDGSGNSYVTGKFEGTATFGATTLTSAGAIDVFVAKLSDAPAGSGACCRLTGCTNVSLATACSDGTFFSGVLCTPGMCSSASDTIGPGGGTIETAGGDASVTFPPGCVGTPTAMSIEWGDWRARIFDVLVTGGTWASTVASYTFEPSGLDFCDTAELCITVNLATAMLTADNCDTVEFKHREGRCVGSPSTECRSDGDCGVGGTCEFTFTNIPFSRPPDCSDPSHAVFCAHIGHFSDYGLLVPADEGIPTVSEWGLIALTLALLAGGKVYFRRRRPVA